MSDIRTVALGTTFECYFNTWQFSSGAPFTLAGTPSMGLRRYGNATQITAGLTLDTDYDSITGYNEVSIVAATAGLVAGETYDVYIAAGTVDSVSAVGVAVDRFRVETATELAIREMNEALFPGHVLSTQTGVSDGTQINLTGIVDSDDTASQLIGEILMVNDANNGQTIFVRVTGYATTNQLATVQTIYGGGAMPFTAASGDKVWRVAQATSVGPAGAALAEPGDEMALVNDAITSAKFDEATAFPMADADGTALVEAGGTGDQFTSVATAAALATVDSNVDAIKVVTDIIGTTQITGVTSGTPTTTSTNTDLTGYVTAELVGRVIIFVGGTADGQAAEILTYTSTNGVVTFAALTTAPAASDSFVIV